MRRRLLLALVGLTAAILIGAVIPLGAKASAHDYSAYLEDAQSRARSTAAAAEELLADRQDGAGLGQDLAAARRNGDGLALLSASGQVIRSAGPQVKVPPALIRHADRSAAPVTDVAHDQVLVVVPIRSGRATVGIVALQRPTERLEFVLRTFWLTLVMIAAAALAAAVLIGHGLSRWASRPLAVLDTAARRLGDGDLSARAAAAGCPAEFRRLADTFNTMAGRLESLVYGHRAVIEDVLHQLRTPLAALRLQLDLLADESGDTVGFAASLDEVARLSRLVDGLLAVARAENATPPAAVVRADEVITERIAAWTPVATEQAIELVAAPSPPAPTLIADGYLDQILDNLIANAADAAGAGSHVTVSATVTPERVRVVVADDGPGMSQADMDRAFRRFATSKPGISGGPAGRAGTAGGSGLGLAIVDRLATSSGGSAELSRSPGGGLTVTVDLPRATSAVLALPGRTGR